MWNALASAEASRLPKPAVAGRSDAFHGSQAAHQHAQRSRNCGRPEHAADSKTRKQSQRDQRAGNRSRRIHRLNQPISRAQPVLRHGLGDHHVARRSAHAFGKSIGEANQQNLRPRGHHRQQRLHRVRDKVSRNHHRLAAGDAVGKISGKKLGKRRHALGHALNQSQLRRPRPQRRQKCRQHPVRHLGSRVVQKRSDAEGVDVARSGRLRLGRRNRHEEVLPRRHRAQRKDRRSGT